MSQIRLIQEETFSLENKQFSHVQRRVNAHDFKLQRGIGGNIFSNVYLEHARRNVERTVVVNVIVTGPIDVERKGFYFSLSISYFVQVLSRRGVQL